MRPVNIKDRCTKNEQIYYLVDNINTAINQGKQISLLYFHYNQYREEVPNNDGKRYHFSPYYLVWNEDHYGNGNILGYDRIDKTKFAINPEQAKTVRMIFDMYLNGMGVTSIQYELEKAGRLTATGKERWFSSYISRVLRNSFYCGIITYHKEFTPDFLKQKKIRNYGEIELLQVQGTHEPIVTVEEFEQVQQILSARTKTMKNLNRGTRKTGNKSHSTAYGRLMICQCGNKFNLRFHSRDGRTDGVDYQFIHL